MLLPDPLFIHTRKGLWLLRGVILSYVFVAVFVALVLIIFD